MEAWEGMWLRGTGVAQILLLVAADKAHLAYL